VLTARPHWKEGDVVATEKIHGTCTLLGLLGRVILKNVNPEYLLRSGETTEFE
jgi:hypothetical protein